MSRGVYVYEDKQANIDMVFEAFTETLADAPGAYFVINGSFGSNIGVGQLIGRNYILAGDFNIEMNAASATLTVYEHIRDEYLYNRDTETFENATENWVNVTYKGLTYQFAMPIEQEKDETGITSISTSAPQISSNIPPRTDRPGWKASQGAYPVPLSVQAPDDGCLHNWLEYEIPTCPASIAP